MVAYVLSAFGRRSVRRLIFIVATARLRFGIIQILEESRKWPKYLGISSTLLKNWKFYCSESFEDVW